MISKIIHYCWFGYNPKPKLAEKCIMSWKRYCPDYQIIEWNEDNFDLSSVPLYVRQAYEAKKWAFVTDYVRLKVVYEYGGIYLDTDVELKKSLDNLLRYQGYFGFEDGVYINTGLGFGGIKGLEILKELMEDYEAIQFIQEDGSYDLLSCPIRNTKIFLKQGLIQDNSFQMLGDIAILPSDWLCPINSQTGKKIITKQTISVHHFSASWHTSEQKKRVMQYRREMRRFQKKAQIDKIIHLPNRIFIKLLGKECYAVYKKRIKQILRMK